MSEPSIANIEEITDAILVHVEIERLDETTTRRLETAIRQAATTSQVLPFVVDLAKVGFLSSLSLGALVRVALEFRNRQQRLMVAALQPEVLKVFETTRLGRILEVQADINTALAAIRSPSEQSTTTDPPKVPGEEPAA